MKKIAVLTSGGDAPGMNAAVRAVAMKAIHNQVEPIAVTYGFKGLVERKFHSIRSYDLTDWIHTGGTKLYTARFPEFKDRAFQEQALSNLKKENIDGLVVIGGDGSFQGAAALDQLGFPTMAVPATIDNDIGGTDFTIGFDTALTTAVDAADKIRDTATSHERIFVVEVMGRHSGDIAYWTAVASGADMAVVPEVDFSIDAILSDIEANQRLGKKRYMIVLAEGVMKSYELANLLEEKGHHLVRVTELGYVQRGGAPSPKDRAIATRLGSVAVDALLNGESGLSVGMVKTRVKKMDIQQALSFREGDLPNLEAEQLEFLFDHGPIEE